MKAITIGQQGKLGNEVLTVVSFNETTFKCDNGKTYMIKNAYWMTEPKQEEAKGKQTKKVQRKLTTEENERLAYLKFTGNDIESLMKKSTENYRNGRSGLSSLTK